MKRVILHIDFDSFFASVEQQLDKNLRGRPIGVTATNGRTCIIAASREAKKLGIPSVTRTWEARKVCPSIITVPAQFEKYWEITQKFLDICKDYSPYVELFSLDEVFIDVTSTEHLFGGADEQSDGARLLDRRGRYEIPRKIKQRIRSEIGEYVTVSVGLSYNKLLAKLASGINKPNGFLEIKEENVEKVYEKAELTDFCGIGFRVEKRLNNIGIYTPLQLRAASLGVLVEEFKDVEGHFLKKLGQGVDDSEVIPYYLAGDTKSVGRNYCIPQNTYDQRVVLQHVFELSEEVGIKLRKLNKKARTAGLYLGGTHHFHGRKTLSSHVDSGRDIYALCKKLYDQWGLSEMKREDAMVRQISVWVGNLSDSASLPLSLFDYDRKSYSKIQEVIDKINDKHGDHTIRNGFLLYGPNLKTVPNGYMADRLERQEVVRKFQESLQTN